MLDFKELSKNGRDLELLAREILFNLGYKVYWSGNGPDGGRDLIFIEDYPSKIFPEKKRWLVQCKHKAESGNSVGAADLDDISDSCVHHNCEGYLLITSTYPSSAVIDRLEAITSNPRKNIKATYWDAVKIEQLLSTPDLWNIAQRFFPSSTTSWKIYATERPNHWVANYEGFYFYICNRIGSVHSHYLADIEDKVAEIIKVNISLPEKHFFRLRNVYFDDKHGTFTWSMDYLFPAKNDPIKKHSEELEVLFDDEWNQNYDIKIVEYTEWSDHYDPDHYNYYNRDIGKFLLGMSRK
ncbi:restriction endonuclease [Pantoea ananatis]|uniref:restriction endonuclease n=1 Tax=Pantoea ananas TaxID=553 RepID=UPI000D97CE85|nr:restriction endonuclease [Pantoea ananatis]PWV88054.1 restriction endonuclease [Pantoea ananatis]